MTGRDDDRFVGYWYFDEERQEKIHGIESNYKSIRDELGKKT